MRSSIIMVIALFPMFLFGQLDLPSVLTRAREQSILFHEARRDIKISDANLNFFKSTLKPQFGLNLTVPNYFKTSKEIVQPNGTIAFQSISQNNSALSFDISQRMASTGTLLTLSSDLQRFDDFTFDQKLYNGIPIRIGLYQPLFQFNRLKWDEKIIPLERKIAEKKYVQDIENIHLNAVNLYFDVLLAQENLEIASKNREINEKLLEIAEERFNLGKISENDQLQLSLELQNATRDYSRANYELQSTVSDLEVFLKNDVQVKNAAVVIPEPFPLLDISLETAITRARNNRSEFLQFTRDLLDAEKETDRVSKLYGFQAELYASFGYARGSQNLSDIYSDPITEQQVTLSLSIPLIDWGRKKEATKIAQAQYDFVQKRNEQDLLDFDNYVSQTVYFFMQLQTEVSAQKQIVVLTEKRYEISRQRYILGDISTTDLSISQREKDQARRNYVSALRDYWSTYYLLRQLTSYDFVENENITYKINL